MCSSDLRYTITRSIPYDRASTSMSCFPLCAECREEYKNPLDRRFHAQPNACPVCGPRLWLTDAKGIKIAENNLAMEQAAYLLGQGEILVMKGLSVGMFSHMSTADDVNKDYSHIQAEKYKGIVDKLGVVISARKAIWCRPYYSN